jgi:hypothetical protein
VIPVESSRGRGDTPGLEFQAPIASARGMRVDDDLWGDVQLHRWKWQAGRVDVAGIIWHSTRSGIAGRTAVQEYASTLNWFRSANNMVRDAAGSPWYGRWRTT